MFLNKNDVSAFISTINIHGGYKYTSRNSTAKTQLNHFTKQVNITYYKVYFFIDFIFYM